MQFWWQAENEIWLVSGWRSHQLTHFPTPPTKIISTWPKIFWNIYHFGYGAIRVYMYIVCCYGNFGAWNFANHVQYVFGIRTHGAKMVRECKSTKATAKMRGWKRQTERKSERMRFLCLPMPFFGNRSHINGKTTQSNYFGRGSFRSDGWMNAENAIRIPQQDCVQSLPELWACKFPHQYPMAYKLFIGCVCKQSIVYSVWSNDRTACLCMCELTTV